MGKWWETSTTCIVQGTDVLNAERESSVLLFVSLVARRQGGHLVLKITDTIKFHLFMQPQIQPDDHLAALLCTTDFTFQLS